MARTFEVIPAIDVRGGRVVRLEQGNFERETVFSDDPVQAAARFAAAGARWLHVVDLDGARSGVPRNLDVARSIAMAMQGTASVEAAGGIRSAESVDAAFAAGAQRVVFGTTAIREPAIVAAAIATHGQERVAAAVDVRGGVAVGDAWQTTSNATSAADLVQRLGDVGVTWFEVTAIDRDGLLGGPDLHLLERIVAIGAGRVIASGGIRNVDDLQAVREVGCVGAIVGRALYEGSFDLAAAIAAMSGTR